MHDYVPSNEIGVRGIVQIFAQVFGDMVEVLNHCISP